MSKKIILPYDKKVENKQRESFWKSQHKYLYPNRGVVSLQEMAELEEKEESKVVSDKGKFQDELFSCLELEILTNDLPPKEKEAVKLRANGLGREETAREMNIKPNAVKQLIHRGYLKIKKKFGRYYEKRISKTFNSL